MRWVHKLPVAIKFFRKCGSEKGNKNWNRKEHSPQDAAHLLLSAAFVLPT
jgi:hypothetical protein